MQIPIKRTVERIPGGVMLAPLLAGAVAHTLLPHAAQFFGSFTGALFEGALPILAVFYVCIGSMIEVRQLPRVLKRGGALLGTKFALGVAAGVVLGRFLGSDPVRAGWFAGVSALAVVAAINDTNGGLYMALMNQYGTAEEAASYSVMGLESGPFLTMVTLGVAGLASFPWPTMLGAVLPLIVGILAGNLDEEMREFLGRAAPAMIPFFAFALGATLNLKQVWAAGLVGIGLGLAVLAVSGLALCAVDVLMGGTGIAGVGAATTAGNAAAVPVLIATANHKYAAAGPATVLVAASVLVTTMLTPLVTAWWDLRVRKGPARRARWETRRLLVIADDLAGAAESVATMGPDAVVALQDSELPRARAVAIDANTRCMTVDDAVAEVRRLVRDHAGEETMLFRKVDSTLRGHVAAELKTLLETRSARIGKGAVAVLAPAFPAHGRTVAGAELLVHGVSLAETDTWARERTAPVGNIAQMLAEAQLRTATLGLERIRSGRAMLERAMLALARRAEVLICDAETEGDLAAIAAASLALGTRVVWVGSAGLTRHLPRVARWGQGVGVGVEAPAAFAAGPTLFVVGSTARASQEQAEHLAAMAELATIRVPMAELLEGPANLSRSLQRALDAGHDVLVQPESDGALRYEDGLAIVAGLAGLMMAGVEKVGALVATGGETARAVLDAWGIPRLRVRGEVEPGVVFSTTDAWWRDLPVVTKAGGFGDARTLVRCRRFLQERKVDAQARAEAGNNA